MNIYTKFYIGVILNEDDFMTLIHLIKLSEFTNHCMVKTGKIWYFSFMHCGNKGKNNFHGVPFVLIVLFYPQIMIYVFIFSMFHLSFEVHGCIKKIIQVTSMIFALK